MNQPPPLPAQRRSANNLLVVIAVVLGSLLVVAGFAKWTAKDEAHQAFLRDQAAKNLESIAADNIARHTVEIGMTEEQCRAAWGKPYDINRTTLRNNSVHKQYVYGSIEYGSRRYLYFEDGVLVSFQGNATFGEARSIPSAPAMSPTTVEEELKRRAEILKRAQPSR